MCVNLQNKKKLRCFLEKFTQQPKILHNRRSRRSRQISSLYTRSKHLFLCNRGWSGCSPPHKCWRLSWWRWCWPWCWWWWPQCEEHQPGDDSWQVAQEEHDHCGDEDDGQVAISRLLGCSSLSQFVWRGECLSKERQDEDKQTCGGIAVDSVLAQLETATKTPQAVRVTWDSRHKWEGYKGWQRVCVGFWICVFLCLISEMGVRRKGFTWREFSSWGKSRSPGESTLRFLVSTKCKYNL